MNAVLRNAFAALRDSGSLILQCGARARARGVGWGGVGEPRRGFVTGSAGPSGNALNDEPRVKKEREKKGRGGGGEIRQLMLN